MSRQILISWATNLPEARRRHLTRRGQSEAANRVSDCSRLAARALADWPAKIAAGACGASSANDGAPAGVVLLELPPGLHLGTLVGKVGSLLTVAALPSTYLTPTDRLYTHTHTHTRSLMDLLEPPSSQNPVSNGSLHDHESPRIPRRAIANPPGRYNAANVPDPPPPDSTALNRLLCSRSSFFLSVCRPALPVFSSPASSLVGWLSWTVVSLFLRGPSCFLVFSPLLFFSHSLPCPFLNPDPGGKILGNLLPLIITNVLPSPICP